MTGGTENFKFPAWVSFHVEITLNEVWIHSEEVCYGLDFSSFDDIATQIHCDDAAGCDGPRRNSAKKDSSAEKRTYVNKVI